jgi:hypothetical protein
LSNEVIDWSERRERVFTTAELEAAPLLWLIIRTMEHGSGGPHYGTQYDLSKACPSCGTGAIQTSSLRLNPSQIPNKGAILQTFDHDRLISSELAQALKEAKITGLTLRTAQSSKDLIDLRWVQLLPNVELPPMASESRGIFRENPCRRCARDGYFHDVHAPTEIKYDSIHVVPDKLPDAVHTYEYFGNSKLRLPFKESYLAQPLLLVKPKIFGIFRQHGVRGIEFAPVDIIKV